MFNPYNDSTPDADLPDRKSVPVALPILVEEAKNACTMGMLLCLDRKQRLIFTLGEILGASDTVGGEVLEMTADNFRQGLVRARPFGNGLVTVDSWKRKERALRRTVP